MSIKNDKFKSNQDVSPDLFEHEWMNKLTRTNVAIPISIFFIYAAGLLVYTFRVTDFSTNMVLGLFFGGLLFFTFVEYIVHRWVYHPPENSSDGWKDFTYKAHGIHHDYPKDKQRLAMPPWASIIVATLLLFIFKAVMSQFAFAFLAGFLTGYASYLLVHYSIHVFKMPNNILKALWVNHSIHHYTSNEIMFGVSSPLWDYVFRTLPKKEVKKGKTISR